MRFLGPLALAGLLVGAPLATSDAQPQPRPTPNEKKPVPRLAAPKARRLLKKSLRNKKKAKSRRRGQVDRTKVVGAPVLDADAQGGVYLWLEDGWFQVAAVGKKGTLAKARLGQVQVRVESTAAIDRRKLGDFRARGSKRQFVATTRLRKTTSRGQFRTEGDVTLSLARKVGSNKSVPIYLGPLAKRVGKKVTIGRY